MFWIKNNKNCIPCIFHFYCIKVWFKGVYISWTCFPDDYFNFGLLQFPMGCFNFSILLVLFEKSKHTFQ